MSFTTTLPYRLSGSADDSASAVVVDRAADSDVPEIVALLADDDIAQSRGDNTADLQPYFRAFAAVDADPAHLLVVARDEAGAEGTGDGTVVATMQLTLIPGLSRKGMTRLQIEAVRVAASHRSTGLGTALIRWAVDVARSSGAGMVQLTSDAQRTDARRFYEKLGFVGSHTGFKLAVDN